MKLEKLSKGKFIKTSIIVLITISIFGVIFINKSKAKYRVTQSIQIVNGTVNYKPADFSLISINLQESKDSSNYTSSGSVPISGYKFNEDKTYCTIGSTKYEGKSAYNGQGITINYNGKNVDFLGFNKANTKCYLYFDLVVGISSFDILADIPKKHPNQGTPNFANTSCSSGCNDTTRGLFTADDDFGTSSYFRGSVDYNWVKFGKVGSADIWWRIVRFNGNGTIRLIYAGTTTTSNAPAETGDGTQLSSTSYNSTLNVKYDNSTIKQTVDTWFSSTSNLNNDIQKQYIDTETGFCNDADQQSSLAFMPYYRLVTTKQPSLKCNTPTTNLFTATGSKGNNKLTYPIGLITVDEASFAGGLASTSNNGYYLCTGKAYWTMSPSESNGSAFIVDNKGFLYASYYVAVAQGVRPVINLKANTVFKEGGTGTSTNPYVVVT